MRVLLSSLLQNCDFQSPLFQRLKPLYKVLFDSKFTVIALLLLGVLRTGLVLLAYAPADGADAMDYYSYAAYMNGADLPSIVASYSPLYPMFIYFNYYILGSFSLLIIWQLLMSSVMGLLYYIGLRPYNALLAVLISLMVIADMETAPMFNLLATEPLYIFLLACLYCVTLLQHRQIAKNTLRIRDVLSGIVLVLLKETRTVGRYLYLPVIVLFAIATRSWKRTVLLGLSFFVTSAVFSLSTQVAAVEQTGSYNDSMLLRPLLNGQLLNAEAGSSSAALAEWVDTCRTNGYGRIFTCLEVELDSTEAAQNLIYTAYAETLADDPLIVYKTLFQQFTYFLRLPGKQLTANETPAVAQCANIPDRIQSRVEHTTRIKWAHIVVTPQQIETYESVVSEYFHQMCPPTYTNQTIRTLVDMVATRYRSLSRPNPYLWYGLLVLAVLGIRWARHLWLPVFLAGGLLAYHAAISAAVYNVQPRYTVITNPFKGILAVTLIFLGGYLLLKLVDSLLVKMLSANSELSS